MAVNLKSPIPNQDGIDYEALVKDDRVHGSLYYDEAIYQEELEKIWYTQWIYIGHDSEVPNPGDFRTTAIGEQPIIFVRDSHGEVQVYLNRCRHRGNTICQQRKGNAQGFLCAYHGWTYNLNGDLTGVPFADGYNESFNKKEYALVKVPRVGNRRGFLFASMAEEGQSFDDFLGRAGAQIDRFCDISPSGKIAVSAGVFQMKVATNWKMWMENSVDTYHAPSTHASNAYMSSFQGEKAAKVQKKLDHSGPNPFDFVHVRDLGNGHTELDMRPMRQKIGMTYSGDWTEGVPEAAQNKFLAAMESFHGKEKADAIAIDGPPHTVMFPNLFFMLQDIRWAVPVSAHETYLYYAPTMLVDAPDEVNAMRLRRDEGAYGPAGFQLSDDLEIWERNFRGLKTRRDEWIMMNRGVGNDISVDPEGSPYQTKLSELSMRTQWQHYKKLMSEG